MGSIALYNYTSQSVTNLPCGAMLGTEIVTKTGGTEVIDGVTWTVTKTSNTNGYYRIEATTPNKISMVNCYKALSAMGLSSVDLFDGDITSYFNTGSIRYGYNSDYTSLPYFTLSKSEVDTSNYDFNINVQPQTYYTGVEVHVYNSTTSTCLLSPVFVATDDTYEHGAFGFVTFEAQDAYPHDLTTINVYFYPSLTSDYVPDAGNYGYHPTSANTSSNKPGVGGVGKKADGTPSGKHPGYHTGTITQPGAPDESQASMTGVGLLTAYKIDKSNIQELAKCLYSQTLLSAIANISVNPLDAIVSLNIFPYNPTTGSSSAIRLLNHVCTALDLGVNAFGNPLTSQYATVDFGTVNIYENWGSFLDYSMTQIELYLPFIGTVELDVAECMDGSVNVEYTIDFITGMCVANVLCTRSITLPSGQIATSTAQHAFQGNCAIQVPLGNVSYSQMVGNLISACTTGLTNPTSGGVKIITDMATGGYEPNVTTKGSIVANAGFCSVLYPYIRITRPITAEPDSYQDAMGYPSYINTTLGECRDLCICDSIDLRSITGATASEIERIRQMCLDGVHV